MTKTIFRTIYGKSKKEVLKKFKAYDQNLWVIYKEPELFFFGIYCKMVIRLG